MSGDFDKANDPFLVFDVAEQLLARIRNGEHVDLEHEFRVFPEIATQIRKIIEQALTNEALDATRSVGCVGESSPDTADDRSNSLRSVRSHVVAPDGYVLVREIARGGMGVVFEARQQQLNRIVAIKMVLGEDSRGVRRFLAEAEAIAAVRHPNVVQVFESGQVGGRPYLTMEYCSGGSLAERFRQTETSTVQYAVEIMLQICTGVAEAHNIGIVHRDLKPANILFDSRGIPKTADFGLAKLAVDLELTNTQFVMGTPAYMSPEQARGEAKFAGPSSDVWALGIILFEFLTRQRPFDGQSVVEILERVRNSPPPDVRRVRRDVPKEVALIVAKCLASEPHQRYRSAGELAQDLQNWLEGRPVNAKPATRPERLIKWVRRNPMRALLVGLGLSTALLLLVLLRHHDRRLVEVRVSADIERLKVIPHSEARYLAESLNHERGIAEPMLRDFLRRLREQKQQDRQAELNAAIAMSVWTDEESRFLVTQSLEHGPEEVIVLRSLLTQGHISEQQFLQRQTSERSLSRSQLLRAVAMLATTSTEFEDDVLNDAVGQMLIEGQLSLSQWLRALEPIQDQLAEPLRIACQMNAGNDSGVLAAIALSQNSTLSAAQRIELIRMGSRRQAWVLGESFHRDQDGLPDLETEWHKDAPQRTVSQNWSEPEDFATLNTEEKVRIGLALISAGRASLILSTLHDSHDPQIRTELVSAFSEVGVPLSDLLALLANVPDNLGRQTIYLALSEYPPRTWTTDELRELQRIGTADFHNHPDPGVHSAISLLFRTLNRPEFSAALERDLPDENLREKRRWFVSPKGISFTAIQGPIHARIGSHQKDAGQDPSNPVHAPEVFHHRHISRNFAISMNEITREQIAEFANAQPEAVGGKTFEINWACRTDDSPAVDVDWYTAAKYCRWLSEQENIPADQQCYPTLSEIREGMVLPADYLSRTGYRLPTEAEWEFACAAGSAEQYWFGFDADSLPLHSWNVKNARNKTHPIASLRPNPFGLFDIHGNVFEWVDVRLTAYPQFDQLFPVVEDLPDNRVCLNGDVCVLRGGDFACNQMRDRSAHRTQVSRTAAWPASGFRIARTISLVPLDVFQLDSHPAEHRYAIRGQKGRFKVSDVLGAVEISNSEGDIPSELTVRPSSGASGRYSFRVASDSCSEQVTVDGEWMLPKWKVRWHKWDRNPSDLEGPTSEGWEKMVSGPVLYEELRDGIRITFGNDPPAPGVPASFCGLVATSELTLAGGRYRFECVKDGGGYRIQVGDRVMLTLACPGYQNRRVAELVLPGGKYPVRVEAYHVVDNGMLDFQISPITGPPPASADPSRKAGGEKPILPHAVGEVERAKQAREGALFQCERSKLGRGPVPVRAKQAREGALFQCERSKLGRGPMRILIKRIHLVTRLRILKFFPCA